MKGNAHYVELSCPESTGGRDSSPTVSVIIATKDRPQDLKLTLECLRSQTFRSFEVIVVDESRDDRTRKVCRNFENDLLLRYYHVRLGSLTRARNFGVERSRGEILVFMDDDIRVAPNFLEKLYEIFERDNDVIGVQGVIISRRATYPRLKNALRKVLMSWYIGSKKCVVRRSGLTARPSPLSVRKRVEAEWFEGSCFAFRKEVFKHLRFDEKLILWAAFEDIDFSYRAYKLSMGKLVIEPSLKVHHVMSTGARLVTEQQYYMHQIYWAYTFFKNLRSRLLNVLAFSFAFFLGDVLLRVISSLTSRSPASRRLLILAVKTKIEVLRRLKTIVAGDLGSFNRKILQFGGSPRKSPRAPNHR